MIKTLRIFISEQKIIPTLILLNLFNIFDAFLTIFWIKHGLAEESNPLMAAALESGIGEFLLLKFSLVLLGSIFLFINREKFLAKAAALMCLFGYNVLLAYHAYGFYLAVF
tara:strand:+ start:1470 stop:1802 length:333 start_codon:yes stop_codon:yes gene_type:complete